uniref:helix-turn-helix transcriptional regulator n=1 Tax=Paractinoplanes polyasparticus TaxID=2856853 RepID=UPI001C85E065|nr:helix-turn-helix transcriptional regulator [Actinoplanes polyasparticus]
MDQSGLAEFLRRRREATRPEEVGLPVTGRRRTPGLRREEVAMLVGTSAERYERLERARAAQPSAKLLASLGRALRLDRTEFETACRLAARPEAVAQGDYVEPGMMALMGAVSDLPALLLGAELTVIEQNHLSEQILGRCAGQPGRRSNLIWHWFTEERLRRIVERDQLAAVGRTLLSELRAVVAWYGEDDPARGLASELAQVSPEFAQEWSTLGVGRFESMPLTIDHEEVGRLDLSCEMTLSTTSGHRLLYLCPKPGSATTGRLRQLAPDSRRLVNHA